MLKPPAPAPMVPPASAPAPTVSTAPTAPTRAQSPDASPAQVPRPAWPQRLQSALQRAEQRILENFRVPPGGG